MKLLSTYLDKMVTVLFLGDFPQVMLTEETYRALRWGRAGGAGMSLGLMQVPVAVLVRGGRPTNPPSLVRHTRGDSHLPSYKNTVAVKNSQLNGLSVVILILVCDWTNMLVLGFGYLHTLR